MLTDSGSHLYKRALCLHDATLGESTGGVDLQAAVAHGLGEVRTIVDEIRAGKADCRFFEMMTFPGGCLAGAGQPIPIDAEMRRSRAAGIHAVDAPKERRMQRCVAAPERRRKDICHEHDAQDRGSST